MTGFLPLAPFAVHARDGAAARLRAALGASLVAAAAVLAAGCFGAREPSPGAVHWDRDIDEECGMVVSDRRFAAQAIDPDGRAHNFDDIGCLVVWLDRQPWRQQARLWVRDRHADRWIAPEEARWRSGEATPSAYGYGASLSPDYGALSFEQIREAIRQANLRKPSRQSRAPSQGRRP